MRNYVTINGVDSTSLAGFLIQELPPLSLPKMRTKTETIDGRDGDIITKLGYSAYDKEITIGLYGSYDIDKINEFFVSEGTIVFSNEPDKYYRFTMVDGIDYDRLVRFRTGKITFHCQPFKYDATETEIDFTNTFIEDTEPYIFRANQHDANMMKLKKVVGGTIAWNQLIQNGNFADGTQNWIGSSSTLSVSNGIARATMTGGAWNNDIRQNTVPVISGHKYFIGADIRQSSDTFAVLFRFPSGNSGLTRFKETQWKRCETFINAVTASQNGFAISVYENGSSLTNEWFEAQNVNVFDITQMFGSTIADYIYSLEQAHAGDGVAWFKALFPKAYYEYNAGELLSVKTSARKTYNADNVEIGSYALDNDIELRGIPKLDSNNELYYDGDTYASDGNVQRKYGIVDLGTLNWNNDPNRAGVFHTSGISSTIKKTPSKSANLVCGKYIMRDASVPSAGNLSTNDKQISSYPSYGGGYVYIIDTAYASSTAEQFKTAMSGVYLVYELATPTTESADAYTESQRVGATEEFVDGRTVEIPVGHNSQYFGTPEITVKNKGNTTSRPTLIIYGEGTITVSLNGDEIFTITMGDHEYITIDTEEMNAYMGGVLLNRSVTGDYSSFVLNAGDNTISLSGNVSEVLIDNYSRWL